jgi:hypothetical protein
MKVTFICGNRTVIHNVTEPKTCEYLVELSTPLVCYPDSMLVYPVLSAELQDEWDTIEGLLQQDIITPKVNLCQNLCFFFTQKDLKVRDVCNRILHFCVYLDW